MSTAFHNVQATRCIFTRVAVVGPWKLQNRSPPQRIMLVTSYCTTVFFYGQLHTTLSSARLTLDGIRKEAVKPME